MRHVVFLLVTAASAATVLDDHPYCAVRYRRLCQGKGRHVACQYPSPGPGEYCQNYTKIKFTREMQRYITTYINRRRQRLAAGTERVRGGALVPRPQLMMQVEWDRELAMLAQRLADQCTFVHDDCRATVRYPYAGQTVGEVRWRRSSDSDELSAQRAIRRVLDAWWGERRRVHPSEIVAPFQLPVTGTSWGHFGQLAVWSLRAVGCAAVRHGGPPRLLLVCDFSHTNMLGQRTLSPGPAVPCPVHTIRKPRSPYPLLCAAIRYRKKTMDYPFDTYDDDYEDNSEDIMELLDEEEHGPSHGHIMKPVLNPAAGVGKPKKKMGRTKAPEEHVTVETRKEKVARPSEGQSKVMRLNEEERRIARPKEEERIVRPSKEEETQRPIENERVHAKPIQEDRSIGRANADRMFFRPNEESKIMRIEEEERRIFKPSEEEKIIVRPNEEERRILIPVDEETRIMKSSAEERRIVRPNEEERSNVGPNYDRIVRPSAEGKLQIQVGKKRQSKRPHRVSLPYYKSTRFQEDSASTIRWRMITANHRAVDKLEDIEGRPVKRLEDTRLKSEEQLAKPFRSADMPHRNAYQPETASNLLRDEVEESQGGGSEEHNNVNFIKKNRGAQNAALLRGRWQQTRDRPARPGANALLTPQRPIAKYQRLPEKVPAKLSLKMDKDDQDQLFRDTGFTLKHHHSK